LIGPHFDDEFAKIPIKIVVSKKFSGKLVVTQTRLSPSRSGAVTCCEVGRTGDARNLSGVCFCSSANIYVICGQSFEKHNPSNKGKILPVCLRSHRIVTLGTFVCNLPMDNHRSTNWSAIGIYKED
jgi:hypothetical protein